MQAEAHEDWDKLLLGNEISSKIMKHGSQRTILRTLMQR